MQMNKFPISKTDITSTHTHTHISIIVPSEHPITDLCRFQTNRVDNTILYTYLIFSSLDYH